MDQRDKLIKFVEMLESGEFTQITGTLGKPGSDTCYCAEGLLLKSLGWSEWDEPSRLSGDWGFRVFDDGQGTVVRMAAPTSAIREVFGVYVGLYDWNDLEGLSFADIAKRVREEYLNV